MPQVDHLSYVSQLFWLILIFLGFYFITLKYILPTISQALKVRQKQMELLDQGATSLKDEESSLLDGIDKTLTSSLNDSKTILENSNQEGQKWWSGSKETVNREGLSALNENYLATVRDLSIQRYLVKAVLNSKK